MTLTRRQELAEALSETLRKLGAFVTNPMPLGDSDRLRFDIPRDACALVCGKLLSLGWRPFPLGETTRVLPSGNAALPQQVCVYELMLPKDKPPPPARQGIFGELADLRWHASEGTGIRWPRCASLLQQTASQACATSSRQRSCKTSKPTGRSMAPVSSRSSERNIPSATQAEPPPGPGDYSQCHDILALGRKMLLDNGMPEAALTDQAIEQAAEALDALKDRFDEIMKGH